MSTAPWGDLPPGFFDATVENCRKVIDSVKPVRARFTIEMKCALTVAQRFNPW